MCYFFPQTSGMEEEHKANDTCEFTDVSERLLQSFTIIITIDCSNTPIFLSYTDLTSLSINISLSHE